MNIKFYLILFHLASVAYTNHISSIQKFEYLGLGDTTVSILYSQVVEQKSNKEFPLDNLHVKVINQSTYNLT